MIIRYLWEIADFLIGENSVDITTLISFSRNYWEQNTPDADENPQFQCGMAWYGSGQSPKE